MSGNHDTLVNSPPMNGPRDLVERDSSRDIRSQEPRDIRCGAAALHHSRLTANQQHEVLGNLLGSVKALVVILDYQGLIVLLNHYAETVTELPSDQATKLRFIDLFGRPHNRGDFVAETSLPAAFETSSITRSGTHLHIFWSTSAIERTSAHETLYVLSGHPEELSEVPLIQNNSNENEQHYRSLFQQMGNGLAFCQLVTDERGNPQDYLFLETNHTFEHITGLKAKDILGRRITTVIPDIRDNQLDWIETYGDVALHGKQVSFEQYSRELGRWFCVSVYSHTPGFFTMVFSDITERKRDEEELIQSLDGLRTVLRGTVTALATIAEMRDPYTAGHQQRVAQLACAIAAEMGLGEDQIECINIASALHDIGKIYVPAELLNKPGRLTDIEFGIIKRHPQASYEIVKSIDFPWPIADIVWQHHERLDGSGYPRGLRANDIDLEARILCVADTVEAMASFRPYRPTLGIEAALECIWLNSASRYDSTVVSACLRLFTDRKFCFQSDQVTPTYR